MANARSEDIKIEGLRLTFPNLDKARNTETDADKPPKLKFGASLLYPKGQALVGKSATGEKVDVAELAVKVATEQWGDKAVQWIKDGVIKSPFLDGDGPQGLSKKTGERHAGYAGHKFIRTSANEDRQPRCVDRKVLPYKDAAAIRDGLYPGCYVNVVVNLFAWENAKGGKGLSFGLSMVQFNKDGERLGGGGGANPDSFFEAIPDEGDAPETTKEGLARALCSPDV